MAAIAAHNSNPCIDADPIQAALSDQREINQKMPEKRTGNKRTGTQERLQKINTPIVKTQKAQVITSAAIINHLPAVSRSHSEESEHLAQLHAAISQTIASTSQTDAAAWNAEHRKKRSQNLYAQPFQTSAC